MQASKHAAQTHDKTPRCQTGKKMMRTHTRTHVPMLRERHHTAQQWGVAKYLDGDEDLVVSLCPLDHGLGWHGGECLFSCSRSPLAFFPFARFSPTNTHTHFPMFFCPRKSFNFSAYHFDLHRLNKLWERLISCDLLSRKHPIVYVHMRYQARRRLGWLFTNTCQHL